MRRAAGPARSAALASRPSRASKNRGPDLAHGSWLVLGGPAAWRQLEGGADLPPSAPLIGVAGRTIRALHRSLMAVIQSSLRGFAGRHHTSVKQGRGRRGSLRPGFPPCQAGSGVVVRGGRSCRAWEAGRAKQGRSEGATSCSACRLTEPRMANANGHGYAHTPARTITPRVKRETDRRHPSLPGWRKRPGRLPRATSHASRSEMRSRGWGSSPEEVMIPPYHCRWLTAYSTRARRFGASDLKTDVYGLTQQLSSGSWGSS